MVKGFLRATKNQKIRQGLKKITNNTEITIDFSIKINQDFIFERQTYSLRHEVRRRLIYGSNNGLEEARRFDKKISQLMIFEN